MKRYGYLFDEICSFPNLLKAANKSQKGKRFKNSVLRFNFVKEKELLKIQEELENKKYKVGRYKEFYIFDPKRRFISALPYRDRVIQHALCNVIEPIFDKSFIHNSYACRKNKGTLRAVNCFTKYCRKNQYVLKCDIKKYFASIDHQVLYGKILQKIKDKKVLWLIRTIIGSTPDPGIPIGNLTSQIFANLYLDELDHYIKEEIKCQYYLRYMDDLIIFADSREELSIIKIQIANFLNKIKLELHPGKSQIFQTAGGVEFLGYKIYPTHRVITKQNIRRLRKRMKNYFKLLERGVILKKKILDSIRSWLGFALHADSYSLRRRLLLEFDLLG